MDDQDSDVVQAVRTRPETSYANPLAEEEEPLENVDLTHEPEAARQLPVVPAPRDVSGLQMIGYGIGHFYNDLCASMWFTYLMIYLEKVVKLQSSSAGFLMLVGQVTDAIATPLVGILSDHSTLPHCSARFGRRLSWHFLGTILVTCSFPFVFNSCLLCTKESSELWTVLWFMPFIMFFQIGWASVQISHLSLMVDLSAVESSRTSMNAIRYGASVVANVFVFALFAVLLRDIKGTSVIGPQDANSFRNAGFVVVGLGLIVSFVFYATIKEPRSTGRSRLNSLSSEISERMYWFSWFKHVQFYQVALLYMFARLSKQYVAILPMVSFISSFVVTALLGVPFVNKLIGHKILCTFAAISGAATCSWMFMDASLLQMYGISAVLGICRTAFLVSSLGMTANMINRSTESGAFVYGGMSFLDKLSNGVTYQIIELLNPSCDGVHKHEICASFYRNVMTFVPGGCAVLFLVVLLTLIPSQIGRRLRRRRRDDDMNYLVGEEVEA
uniref:MFS domain-containing protein n=1 Tax=Steinernema glaseri TaxID=37863 RepID=A0A1I7YPA0_9BILA